MTFIFGFDKPKKMKSNIFLFSLLVVLGNIVFAGTSRVIKEEHRKCEVNTDCVVMALGECCAQGGAVNKKFSSDYQANPDLRCLQYRVTCGDVKAVCEKGSCALEIN